MCDCLQGVAALAATPVVFLINVLLLSLKELWFSVSSDNIYNNTNYNYSNDKDNTNNNNNNVDYNVDYN